MAEEPTRRGRGAVAADEEILDFSGVTPFEPLDSREIYLVRTTKLDKKDTSTGSKMYTAELEVVGPTEVVKEIWEPDEDAEGGMKFVGYSDEKIKATGRKLFRNFSLEPQSRPFLYNYLKAMNPGVVLNEAFRLRPAEWIGMELAIKGQNRAYNEQVRLQPNNLYPANRYEG